MVINEIKIVMVMISFITDLIWCDSEATGHILT